MQSSWHDINTPGRFSHSKGGRKEPEPVDIEPTQNAPKPRQEAEVKLVSATWEPGPEGHQFNKKSTLKIKAEFLKETGRKRIICSLFVVYNGAEEDLKHQVEAFLDSEGNATAQMTLFYGEAYSKALKENPSAICQYKAKIKHSTAVKELTSEPLEMPCVEKLKVNFVEVADIHFHHNCALPCLDEKGDLIAALVSVFVFAAKNTDRELVIEGHADRSGDPGYNLQISKRRAEAIKALLENDAGQWNAVVGSDGKDQKIEPEDYQRTLKYLSVKYGWTCDPGNIDNQYGPKTENGAKAFQKEYNSRFIEKGEIPVDGKVGPKTWEAIFNVLRFLLIEGLKSKNIDALPELSYGYPDGGGMYPCGESSPVTGLERSAEDRRVELVFYKAGEWSPAIPPAAGRKADPNKDPVSGKPWEKSAVPLDDIILPEIKILSIDDHFAPGKEKLVVDYELKWVAEADMQIDISGDQYPNNPVYTVQLSADEKSDGKHTFEWEGMTNCADGPLKDMHINPLYAPYTVKVYKSDACSASRQFQVLYHSIDLSLGSYTADGNEPNRKAEQKKWVKYKLNALGYFSGPVDGSDRLELSQAIMRYTYAMPGMDESGDGTKADFQEALVKDKGKRIWLEGGALPVPGAKAKLFIDHDYYYEDVFEFKKDDATGDKDSAKLSRIEFPVECTILLVGKNDKDGTGKGIESPEGVGPVEVEWTLHDPIEDMSIIPVSNIKKPERPAHAKEYIEKMLKAKGQVTADAANALDNCPAYPNNNGSRGTNQDCFYIGNMLPPFTSRNDGDRIFSKVHYDKSSETNRIGRTGIIARLSYIAGDNFTLSGQLVFEGLANKDLLIKNHEDFAKKKITDALSAKTGQMTIWRRHHIAALVNWPGTRATAWDGVKKAYEAAHIDLVTAPKTFNIATLFTAADKKYYENLVKAFHPAYTPQEKATIQFTEDCLYALPIPPQGSMSGETYQRNLTKLASDFLEPGKSLEFESQTAELIQKAVHRTETPGAIVGAVEWIKPVQVKHHFLLIPYHENFSPAIHCIGLPHGVALLANPMRDYQDQFLISHEIGHCHFLMHHETDFSKKVSDNPAQHDIKDHNCIMSYPHGIASRKRLGWKTGDGTEATFCGKCLLKLRGWAVAKGDLPVSS